MALELLYKETVIFVKLLRESVSFAFSQLWGDKFRTFLSLFGVSVGIFTIVAIFTAIDALQENVRKGFETMNSNVVMVSQWPMVDEDEQGNANITGEFRWWEYMRRPATSYEDYRFIKENSTLSKETSFSISTSSNIRYGRKSLRNANVECITHNYNSVTRFSMQKGRYFTPDEDSRGTAVAVIGAEVAASLFEEEDPIGKKMKVGPAIATVVGVMEKQGESIVSLGNMDYAVYVPLNFGRYYLVNPRWASNSIYAVPKEGVSQQALTDELRMLMRAHRRLAPGQKNNFSVNTMTLLTESVGQIFSMINAVGWIIAGFSLLIGGFGIANIMFVSVKERTNIIGIQKALGAKKYVIIAQFLSEAAVLAVAGGIIGILLVFFAVQIIPSTSFNLTLSAGNIVYGVSIASVIGILAGIIPAFTAANLNPVDAINSR